MTFYTIEINRFGGISWPTNPELFATENEYTLTETRAWALLYRFTSDWRAATIMHSRFIKLARRAQAANVGGEDIAKGDSTEYIDDSTSMDCEENEDLPRTEANSAAESEQEEEELPEETETVDLTVEEDEASGT